MAQGYTVDAVDGDFDHEVGLRNNNVNNLYTWLAILFYVQATTRAIYNMF